MERLNNKQLRGLKERHPHNNRIKFFDAVSLVTISGKLNWEKENFLQEMTKLSLNVSVRLTNA